MTRFLQYHSLMRSRLRLLLTAAVLALAAGSVQSWGQGAAAPYRNVSPSELEQMLAHKDFFFVNVHIPYEGEIAPTDAFIPFDRTEPLMAKYPADKSARIVLYCRSGRMSDIAARKLAAAGYKNLFNLAGGMIAWQETGLQVVTDPAKSQE